jgi:alanine racemase
MSRPTTITIHLDALHHNLQRIKTMAPHSRILAMVKSNAYGHGIERIASALPYADALGVACIEEGMILRDAGIKKSIVLMEGLFSSHELTMAAHNHFTIIIHHLDQVIMLEKNTSIPPLSVWLKIDTGMHRLGFEPPQIQDIHQRLLKCSSVKKPIGLMTHFAKADALDSPMTQQQIDLFNTTCNEFNGPQSLSNSAAIIAWPSAHKDWVRPGIMLYGTSPFASHIGEHYGLKPVMSFSSRLIAIHRVLQGADIGYGGHWTAPEDMLVGIVGAGYGDGYPRHAKNGTPILVNGIRCPLVGHVAMDMLTVDLRNAPTATVGDSVLLWGPTLPVEEIAECCETIGYELLTRITQRVHVAVEGKVNNHPIESLTIKEI